MSNKTVLKLKMIWASSLTFQFKKASSTVHSVV